MVARFSRNGAALREQRNILIHQSRDTAYATLVALNVHTALIQMMEQSNNETFHHG